MRAAALARLGLRLGLADHQRLVGEQRGFALDAPDAVLRVLAALGSETLM